MSEIINPISYGIDELCRIVIKHVEENKIVEKSILKINEEYQVPDKYFDDGILNYKIKIQRKLNDIWYDEINYFYLWNLAEFFSGKVDYDDGKLKQVISYNYELEKNGYSHTRHALNTAVKNLENPSISTHKNIEQYLDIVKRVDFTTPYIWENINVLIEHLLLLKKI